MTKTSQDQQLALSPQNHLLFYWIFFDKEHGKHPQAIMCGWGSLNH